MELDELSFNRILPNIHPHDIEEPHEAYKEIISGIENSILKSIDYSLPTVVLVGGLESYLIAHAIKKIGLPYSTIAVYPHNSAMRYYCPNAYNSDDIFNGFIPEEVLSNISNEYIIRQSGEISSDFKRAARISRKSGLLNPSSEFTLTGIMSLLKSAYIEAKTRFDTDKVNVLYGGYGSMILSGNLNPQEINERISHIKDSSHSLYNLFNMAMISMNTNERGSFKEGMKISNPFLGYTFYKSASSISPGIRTAYTKDDVKLNILELAYLYSLDIDFQGSPKVLRYIPKSLSISQSLRIEENILYNARA